MQEKKSFQYKNERMKKEEDKKTFEFGAIIKNDPKNSPNTGEWKNQFPVVDRKKCIGCGLCKIVCPEGAISIEDFDGEKKAVIDMRVCKGEGMCATVCPKGAITIVKKK